MIPRLGFSGIYPVRQIYVLPHKDHKEIFKEGNFEDFNPLDMDSIVEYFDSLIQSCYRHARNLGRGVLLKEKNAEPHKRLYIAVNDILGADEDIFRGVNKINENVIIDRVPAAKSLPLNGSVQPLDIFLSVKNSGDSNGEGSGPYVYRGYWNANTSKAFLVHRDNKTRDASIDVKTPPPAVTERVL